jgi:hypothetical protein
MVFTYVNMHKSHLKVVSVETIEIHTLFIKQITAIFFLNFGSEIVQILYIGKLQRSKKYMLFS